MSVCDLVRRSLRKVEKRGEIVWFLFKIRVKKVDSTCEILVSRLDALFVPLLVGVEVTHVDADEGTGRDVTKGPDAPTPLLSFEYLKLQPGRKKL